MTFKILTKLKMVYFSVLKFLHTTGAIAALLGLIGGFIAFPLIFAWKEAEYIGVLVALASAIPLSFASPIIGYILEEGLTFPVLISAISVYGGIALVIMTTLLGHREPDEEKIAEKPDTIEVDQNTENEEIFIILAYVASILFVPIYIVFKWIEPVIIFVAVVITTALHHYGIASRPRELVGTWRARRRIKKLMGD